MVKLNGIYDIRWCGFLRDRKGCRENALQPGLPVRCTAGLHHSSHTNMVWIGGNNFHHITVLIHGCIYTEGAVGMSAYHNVSHFVRLLIPEGEFVFASY